MKNLKKLLTNLNKKIHRKINIFNEYHNPIYHWWKARKYIKFPHIHVYCGKFKWFYGLYINKKCYNPILGIRSSALGYKFKYDNPVFEYSPMINIVFFRKYQLTFIFTYSKKNDDDWCKIFLNEIIFSAILDYIYNNIEITEDIYCGFNQEIRTRINEYLK